MEDKTGWTIVVVQFSMLAIAMIVTFCRIYVRRKRGHRLGADDWWIVAAWISSICHVAIGTVGVKNGSGRHIKDVPANHLETFLLMIWFLRPTYQFIVFAIKMSFLCLYLRMFPSRKLQITIWVLITIIALQSVALILAYLFQCIPVDAMWLIGKSGKCVDGTVLVITGASLNVAGDLTILILPIPILLRLNVDRKRRLGIILTFSLGSLACAAAMVRLVMIKKFDESNDKTYNTLSIAISSALEVSLGVIIASLPLLRPELQSRLKRTWSSRSRPQPSDEMEDGITISDSSIASGGTASLEKKAGEEYGLEKGKVKFALV